MMKCKQASNSECGKTCCCFECETKDTCESACTKTTSDGCEDAITEETAMKEFNTKALAVMKQIAEIDKQKKDLEEQDKQVREALKTAMSEYGIKSFDNDILKVTYVAPTSKTTIDSKSLKKDLPDVAAKYSKTSSVAASVRISVK